jgi:hypothetical protein
VLVDTGYFMSDERSAHARLRPDAIAKDDWVKKAYEQTDVDVVNVSSHDLSYFSSALAKAEFERQVRSSPLLRRLVSANTVSESPAILTPRPFIVQEVPSRETGATKPLRVAFIGLTETTPAAPPGFKFIDPAEAARRTIPRARSTADVVIALAKVSSEEAARIAREAPGIDVIIAGNSVSLEQSFTPPFYTGQTLVVFTPFETRMLGELRFYRGSQGRFTTRQRFIVLDEFAIQEDPAAKKFVDGSTVAESQARDNSKTLLDTWLASVSRRGAGREPAPAGKSGSDYVTSAACNQCHAAQYMKWANSAHARATDPLPPRSAEFEPSCLGCHATGSGPAATDQLKSAVALSVQCEQCHGPGGKHVAKPAKGYGRVADLKAACVGCHSTETSPGFNVAVAWEKIKH